MSEQPTAHQTYRVPHQYPEVYTSRIENQPSPLERIQYATNTILHHRQTRLDRVLEIDIQDDESLWRKVGRKVAELFTGEAAPQETLRGITQGQLMTMESEICADLFDPIPSYDKRQFFCADQERWIWHEERINVRTGKYDVMTISYTITETGIMKKYNEENSHYLDDQELENLVAFTEAYTSKVCDKLYPSLQDSYRLAT